ncbi:hypothetical protein, partial [Mesorhizobium sp. M0103]|uniref:hypothetical protein n=1 Tax=Mesorhizobium sp. M0103 TaxID=2956879 RepID=UPI003334B306
EINVPVAIACYQVRVKLGILPTRHPRTALPRQRRSAILFRRSNITYAAVPEPLRDWLDEAA